MTETRTPRFNLPQWSAGTDSPSRSDFNGAFSDIEGRGAYDNGDNVSSLPVTGLVAGRYSMLTVSGDGYSLYRYSGSAWQFVGGSLVPRFQRFKAIEGQLITDAAFTVEHPSEVNANIIASYGGDLTVGGVLKSWNANDAAKGALVVGWNGAISLTTTGRAYMRTRANTELGLVLHAHGSGAGNMLTVREPGNSDIFTVDAIGRLTQRTFAAFGGASLPSTSMVAVAPTSAADAVVNGLLLYGQAAATTKTILSIQPDNTADTTPIAGIARTAITLGRLPWGTVNSTGTVTLAGNTIYLRATGDAGNTAYLSLRRSDPTSPVTEANPALDTTIVGVSVNGVTSSMPMFISQRLRPSVATMALYRVSDFTSSFLDLARLVPDGLGGETTQLAATWDSDGRLRSGAWWRSTGTVRDARQSVMHVCRKVYAAPGSSQSSGQQVDPGDTHTLTWTAMTMRSSGATDIAVEVAIELMLQPNSVDGEADAQDYSAKTFLSINGGSFVQIGNTENAQATPFLRGGQRYSGDYFVFTHRSTAIPAGATIQLRTQFTTTAADPVCWIRSMEVEAEECIIESYAAP